MGNLGGPWRAHRWLQLFAVALGACVVGGPQSVPTNVVVDPTLSLIPSSTPTGFLPPATPTPECVPSDVIVEVAAYPAVATRADVPVVFFLPDCPDQPSDGLPVVFLLHGKPMTEQQWLDLALPDLLREGWQSRRWPPMAVVAARQPEPLFSNTDGGRGSYEQEFLEGLIPFAESAQAIARDAPHRAVLGISRGGVWALEIAMTHPDDIGAVAALSPALAVNYARPAYDPLDLAGSLAEFPRFYLGAGTEDWAHAQTERLARSLESTQADFLLQVVPGVHDEATWGALLPSALDFIAAPWGKGWATAGDRQGEIR